MLDSESDSNGDMQLDALLDPMSSSRRQQSAPAEAAETAEAVQVQEAQEAVVKMEVEVTGAIWHWHSYYEQNN